MKTPELFLILLVGGCGVGPVTSPNPNEDASAAPGNDGFAGEGNDGSVESGGPGNLAVATAPDNGVARDLAIPEGADLSVGEGSRDLAMAKAPDLSVLPPGADLAMSIAPPDLAMAHPGADLAMSVHPSDLAMSVATDLATSVHPPDLAMSVATDLATSAPPTDLATSAPPTGSEFLGGAEGLGTPVIDASPDESGNVWAVAPDALYIRRAGQTSFRRYTNADGLHIWTTITSVAGAGTNEGYLGLQGYESDDPVSDPPDLQVQGKAEHVHLHADGTIDALHYSNLATDVDPTYTKTRTAYRLLFSHDGVSAGHLFMGGNHGITHIFNDGWGDHVHVEIYYMPEHSGTYGLWYGLAIDPKTGGLWTCGKNGCGREEYIATPRQWSQGHYDTAFTVFTSDHGLEVPHGYEEQYVGAATTPDGTAWFASRLFGLAKWEGGTISPVVVPGLGTPVDIAGDPDGSLWVTDGSQVLRYVPSTGATTSLPLGSSDVRRLYVWSHGPRALYISTGGGLQIFPGTLTAGVPGASLLCMAEITVEELLERQARMSAAMEEISKETDANRIVEMAAELQEEGRELEAMAREFEAQETAKASQNLGSIEVKLTDAQRKRILDETGVEMHTLVLADPSGSLNENMPNTSPELIEFWALEEARRRKAKGEAEEAAQEQIADAINDIREQGTPQLQELLDEKLADPSFLAGIRPK